MLKVGAVVQDGNEDRFGVVVDMWPLAGDDPDGTVVVLWEPLREAFREEIPRRDFAGEVRCRVVVPS